MQLSFWKISGNQDLSKEKNLEDILPMIRYICKCYKGQGIIMSTKGDFHDKEQLLAIMKVFKKGIMGRNWQFHMVM